MADRCSVHGGTSVPSGCVVCQTVTFTAPSGPFPELGITVTLCRYGYDDAHELLQQTFEGVDLDWDIRAGLKDKLFQCHYGATPCGWVPQRTRLLQRIVDGLAREASQG